VLTPTPPHHRPAFWSVFFYAYNIHFFPVLVGFPVHLVNWLYDLFRILPQNAPDSIRMGELSAVDTKHPSRKKAD